MVNAEIQSVLQQFSAPKVRFADFFSSFTPEYIRMGLLEDLINGFQAVTITINDEILQKCEELCTKYKIEGEDFVDQWLAYTASNLNGAPPSLDALDKMERKELQKQAKKAPVKTPKSYRTDLPKDTTPVRYNLQKEFKEQSPVLKPTPIQEGASEQFSQRTDSRSVQCHYGKCGSDSFKERAGSVTVKIQNEQLVISRYMYEKLLVKREVLNVITKWVASDILNYHKLELTKAKLKDYFGEMTICGRVYAENLGKGNVQSIFFEGLLEYYNGHMTELNVNHVDKVALFNGEVVVIKGNNMKERFVAKEIYASAPLPLWDSPIALEETLQIVLATGPFTFSNNLLYEPLEDLLKYVVEFKPNLLILMGPFVEVTNTVLETMNENYDSFFETIVEGIVERLKGTGVNKIILIPSPKDLNNHVIFPSPGFKIRKRYDNVICAPNPCILDIDGLILGASSVDVLSHMNKSEIKNKEGTSSDVLRLISYLFNQRSFYPLHPPDIDVRIDYQLLEKYGMLEKSPHLMFLQSDFNSFAKRVQDCLVINAQTLIKGQSGGTFARVEIRPGMTHICNRISCQILRI